PPHGLVEGVAPLGVVDEDEPDGAVLLHSDGTAHGADHSSFRDGRLSCSLALGWRGKQGADTACPSPRIPAPPLPSTASTPTSRSRTPRPCYGSPGRAAATCVRSRPSCRSPWACAARRCVCTARPRPCR